jgi:hypothetical protein
VLTVMRRLTPMATRRQRRRRLRPRRAAAAE